MVYGALAVQREQTTRFGDWGGTNYVSVSPGRRKARHRTDMLQEKFTVSNEVAPLEDIHTGSLRRGIAQGEAFQGLVESIPEGYALTDLQDNIDVAEKKFPVSKNVRAYRRSKKLAEAVDWLNKFENSLGTAEAPMHINLAKKALANSWQSITEEDSEIRITIASLEGALRQRKWQDYSLEQVRVISGILTDCIAGRLDDLKSVLDRLSILRKKNIDIYPSASEEDYVEEEEEI